VRCTIEARGAPLRAFGGAPGNVPAELAEIGSIPFDLRLVHLGREGKRLAATVPVAGIAPEQTAGDEHLRMQAMLTENVEWDRIVLDRDWARDLRHFAMSDRNRSDGP